MLKVAFSPIYKYQLPQGHRFPMVKYELLPEQLILEGTITEANFFSPNTLSDQQLLTTHTSNYIQQLHQLPLPRKLERAIGFPVRDDLIIRGRQIASGTFECAFHALKYGIAMNIAGGTHHAYADHGEGFCVFNDVALAIRLLRTKGYSEKVLIVDLDVHQGNGTASIFQNDDSVFTFSMHGAKNYPLRKESSDLDIGLSDGTTDNDYLKQLRNNLPTIVEEFQPSLVFYIAGVDILEQDLLGRLNISISACKKRDETVMENCKLNDIPLVAVMGGGYAPNIKDIIEAHANTFRVAQEMYF